MRIKQYLMIGLISSLSYHAHAFSNYASKEYVDSKVINITNSLNKQIDEVRISPHFIGESYQGGMIFWVDDTGIHGLIAAKHDANDGVGLQWKNGESGEKIVNARGVGIGSGQSNTRLIIAQQTIDYQPGNFAALAAANFSVLADGTTPCANQADQSHICYGDWYLPSIYELDLMYRNLGEKGHFSPTTYWSSTEYGVSEAWLEAFQTGMQSLSDKSNASALVRAIRAF